MPLSAALAISVAALVIMMCTDGLPRQAVASNPFASKPVWVYFSKNTYTGGELGSRAQADAICQNTANWYEAAGGFPLSCSRTFAYLGFSSDNGGSPSLNADPQGQDPNISGWGPVGFMAYAAADATPPSLIPVDLIDTMGNFGLYVTGQSVSANDIFLNGSLLSTDYWLGYNASGQLSDNCKDWSSPIAKGIAAITEDPGIIETRKCTSQLSILCVCNQDTSVSSAPTTPRPTIPVASLAKSSKIFSGWASSHWCSLMTTPTGALRCIGSNVNNELGIDSYSVGSYYSHVGVSKLEMGQHLVTVNLPAAASLVATGDRFTCALGSDAKVRCWGLNDQGQLGQGHTDAVQYPAVVNLGACVPSGLFAGADHVCATCVDLSVHCWGAGDTYKLGNGVERNIGTSLGDLPVPAARFGPVNVKSGSAGLDFTCVLTDKGLVKCVGSNDQGQCGAPNVGELGVGRNQLGANLPFVQVVSPSPTAATVKQITSGQAHTCALLSNNQVKCWGDNSNFQLGVSAFAGTRSSVGGSPGDMGDNLPYVGLGTGAVVTSISAGAYHTCATLTIGTATSLKCWGGDNAYGTLGQENHYAFTGDSASTDGMGDLLPAIKLGAGRKPAGVVTGTFFSCALLDNGLVKCWGTGYAPYDGNIGDGALGQGFGVEVWGNAPNEMGDNLPYVNLGLSTPTKMPTSFPSKAPTRHPTPKAGRR